MKMLAPSEEPNSAVASREASTKWVCCRARRGRDRALEALGRQREIGIAGEVARQELGGVDDHRGLAGLHRRQHLLVAGDDDVAAEHEVGAARRDADGVDVLGTLGDPHVAVDRAALLREAGHVDDADALAFEMRRHAEDAADGDDAGAADAGDDDVVGLAELRQLRLGQRGHVVVLRRRPCPSSASRHAP